MARFIVSALLLACISLKAATANQILSQARSFQGLSDRELQISTAYSLAVYTGLAGLPVGSILASAYSQGFGGLDDRSLQIIQSYAMSQGLISIFVTPNTNSSTYGIQEALNAVPPGGPSWGTNVTGALIQLAAGDYYVTNGAFYSNTFKYNIKIRGSGILNTRLFYVSNNNTRTNLLRFCGGGNPNGPLDLPGHVELEDLTFSSLTNDLIELVCITNCSEWKVRNCNFTGYEITTNQTHGAQLSIDGPYPTQQPGNVGLVAGTSLDHAGFLEDTFFANLASGFVSYTDHLYAYAVKSAFIGVYIGGGSGADGNLWPTTSPNSLGALIILRTGLGAVIQFPHFYIVNGGIANDAGMEVSIISPIWEQADHGISWFNPSGSSTLSIYENGISTGADDTLFAINHSPYSYSATTALIVKRPVFTTMIASTGLNGNNNQATNFGQLSAALFTTPTNLIAAGFNPDFSKTFETAATNGGPIIFGLPKSLPAADYAEHIISIENSGASDQPVVATTGYITNFASNVMRCTNQSKVVIEYRAGKYTNFNVYPKR